MLFVPTATETVTLTGSVIDAVPLTLIAVVRVQVMSCPLKVQEKLETVRVPVQFGVIPVGSVSLTVIVPEVATCPELVTVKVYVAPDCETVQGPLADLVIERDELHRKKFH